MLSLLLASLIAPAFVRPQPCVALQESVPAVAAQGAGAAEDEFARLVPNEACFVVRARSLQRLYDSAREVMRGIAKDSEFPSMQSMLDRLGSHADASQIALDQPIGLALAVDAQGETSITLIVPALDAAALSASIEDPDPKAKKFTLGKFVVVSDAPNYAPNKSPSPIATGMASGDIALRIDAAKLIAMFAPVIDQTLTSLEQAFASGAAQQPGAIGVSAVLEQYVAWARTLVQSAETLDISASNDAGMLSFSGALTCRAGSPMATWLGEGKLDIARAARLLDPNAALQYVIAGDLPKLCASMTSLFAALADQAPEDMREALGDEVRGFEALCAQMGTSVAMNGEWTADGLRGCAYVQAKDPAALLASYMKLLDNDVLARSGLQVQVRPDVELAGAKWKSVRVQFDAEALARLQAGGESDEDAEEGDQDGEPAEQPPADTQMLQQALEHLYGAQGLEIALTANGDQLVVLIGAEEARAKAALARVDAKAPGLEPALAAALARVDKSNGALVMRFDYGVLVEQMLGLLHGVGGPTEMFDALAGLHLPITSWAAIDGRVWKAGVAVRVADLTNVVSKVQERMASQMRRSVMQADILSICTAIDVYMIENGGLAPESLEVLVTPDANGRTFLNDTRTVPLDPWQHPYRYAKPSANTDYRVYTLGRDDKPGGNGEDIDLDNFTIAQRR